MHDGMNALMSAPGVISKAPNYYIGVNEVMYYLGCKENKAYEVIRGLRKELEDAGRLYSGVPQGKMPRKYFMERCMIDE